MAATVAASVGEYIDAQSVDRRAVLHELRRVILAAVPDAAESISYAMPTYRFPNGHPVYFAGWKRHVSLHDIPSLGPDLEAEVKPFRSGKDTLKFANTIPFDVISRIMTAIAQRPVSPDRNPGLLGEAVT